MALAGGSILRAPESLQNTASRGIRTRARALFMTGSFRMFMYEF
jgi:hypothetical protein